MNKRELTPSEKRIAKECHGGYANSIRAHGSGFYVQGLRTRSAKSYSTIQEIPKKAFKSVV